jgi:type IV pilus assembly protein PilW
MKAVMDRRFFNSNRRQDHSGAAGGARRRVSMRHGRSPGFSLIELLIAMSVGLVVIGAAYSLFTSQNKQLGNQELIAEMQQNARAAMDIVSREIRMAGYNANKTAPLPKCTGTTSTAATCVGIKNAGANTISFTADLNGNGDLTAGTANPNENIIYDRYLSSGVYALGRTSNGTKQPLIEHLDFLGFSYFDANGTATTNLANIREVRITIRTVAAKPDPDFTENNGYRTYTLIARVAPRNLAY